MQKNFYLICTSHMETHIFFIQLVILLISARFLAEIAARFQIPPVIGELAAGIILGPSLFNFIQPNDTLHILAQIGAILLLFEVGLETDIIRLSQASSKSLCVAIGGVALPFLFGFFVSLYCFSLSPLASMFIGATLTATSIGITLRVLSDLRKQESHEAQIVLGAAVLDDIIGIILLSLLYEFSTGGGISFLNAGKVLLFITIYMILAPFFAKVITEVIRNYEKRSEIPGLLPTSIVSLILLFAWLSSEMGAPELMGGFAAGLALSRRFYLPLGSLMKISHEFVHTVESQMKPIIHLFTPIFFVTIGLSLNLKIVDWTSSSVWTLGISLTIIAFLGKLASGWLMRGEDQLTKLAVGISMVPRGEVGLIFAEVGLKAGIFNNDMYAVLILVIALTTLLPPFALRRLYASS